MRSALRIVQAVDNRLNPIVVKEMRQLVQSRWVLSIIMLFLFVILGTMVVFAINSSAEIDTYTTQTLTVGRRSFLILAMIFSVTCMFFIPAYTGLRLSGERSADGMDLLYVTTLTPSAIIRGKFLAGILLCVLILSVSLPFMVLCYYLKGIDLPTMAFALFLCLLFVIVINQGALFIACLPVQKLFKIGFGIGAALLVYWFTAEGLYEMLEDITRRGYEDFFKNPMAWWALTFLSLLAALFTGFFYRLCVALISPPSMDRLFGLRVYVSAMWLVSLLLISITYYFIHTTHGYQTNELSTGWYILCMIFVMLGLLVSISENENRNARIRARIPRNRFLRRLAFFFYCGPANGLAWCAMLGGLSGLTGLLSLIWVSRRIAVDEEAFTDMGILTLYAFGYAISALFIRKLIGRFFKHFTAKYTWVVCLLLVATGALYYYVFWLVFAWSDQGDILFSLQRKFKPLNIFDVIESKHTVPHLWTAVCWLVLLIVPLSWWFYTQTKRFIPSIVVLEDPAADRHQGGAR